MPLLSLAATLLTLVNAQRVRHHEPPLAFAPRIGVCRENAEALDCVEARGLRTRRVGIITAWGWSTPRQFVQAWLHSPPHRAIMLRRSYRRFGSSCNRKAGLRECRVVFVGSG